MLAERCSEWSGFPPGMNLESTIEQRHVGDRVWRCMDREESFDQRRRDVA
jgi:hypothetical protein